MRVARSILTSSTAGLAKDQSGAMAVIMAMTLAVMLTCIGCAVDFLRWHNARAMTASAIDAAVLAAGRSLVMHPQDAKAAEQVANRIYQNGIAGRIPVLTDSIRFTVDPAQGTVEAVGTATLGATILSTVGIDRLGLVSESQGGLARAEVSPGGPGGSNLEVAVMLDVTGSMCDDGIGPCANGTKIDGLKSAATDLVNIVVKPASGSFTTKVALVPFATKVRIAPDGSGGALMKSLTNLDPTWSGVMHECQASTGGGGSETSGTWACSRYADVAETNLVVMPCVSERAMGWPSSAWAPDMTDDAPGAGHWLNGHDGTRREASVDSSDTAMSSGTGVAGDPADFWNFNSDGVCDDIAQGTEVVPLTTDKALLLNHINGLQAYGATAGALGTSWAWYVLSPNWNAIWAGESTPGSYADVAARQSNGAPLLRKIAVLMTDGGFNTFRTQKEQDQQAVSTIAVNMCSAMKAQGIEVYTVGFHLDQLTPAEAAIARATLTACGTDVSHFYETLDVPALKTAFQSIGSQMAGLRLTR